MNRNDLKLLAVTRLREAKVLLANGEYSGAYYLAGYVVECALKACIAKRTKRHDFPDRKIANKAGSMISNN
ncbi:MAG TPA: HEPN domain-containing protein [Blastocatellia bacterium]|nr:HEPN domain-containing protein [Blastocatellia bacterium]